MHNDCTREFPSLHVIPRLHMKGVKSAHFPIMSFFNIHQPILRPNYTYIRYDNVLISSFC